MISFRVQIDDAPSLNMYSTLVRIQGPLSTMTLSKRIPGLTKAYSTIATFSSHRPMIIRRSSRLQMCSSMVLSRLASTSSGISLESTQSVPIPVNGTPPNLLELMDLHATTLTGTIFSDTGPVIMTADFLCYLKDIDGMKAV